MVFLNEEAGKYEVQYSLFDETELVEDFTYEPIREQEEDENRRSARNISGFI